MKTDITPADSVCPIFLQPADPAQVAADKAQEKTQTAARVARATDRKALLDRLGITSDEADLLLS